MSFSFHVPQIVSFKSKLSPTSLPSLSTTLSTFGTLTTASLGGLYAIGVNGKKRKLNPSNEEPTENPFEVWHSLAQDMKLFQDFSLTETQTETQNEVENMSASNAPLSLKGYLKYGSPLNNMYPVTQRAMVSWGTLFRAVTGQQNWAVVASIGTTTQVGQNVTDPSYAKAWPLAYLNQQPDTQTTDSNIADPTFPLTTSIGVSTVYTNMQFKNLQNVGVEADLYVISAVEAQEQDPVQDLIDSASQYGQTLLPWAPPVAGETIGGSNDGRPTIHHIGFRWHDAEDVKRKFKVLRKHRLTFGHGQTISVDYTVDFNRVYSQMEVNESLFFGHQTFANKTLYFVLRYSGEPVVDITPASGGNNITTADVSICAVVSQKKIFRVPKGMGKLRINYGASRLSSNVTDANQQTMDVEDNKDAVKDAFDT